MVFQADAMVYLVVKYLHVSCVLISIGGFFIRGMLAWTGSPLEQLSWWRWIPHVNDTVLLLAAITLAVLTGQYPFYNGWLTAKVVGLIVYIFLGSIALRPGRPRSVRIIAWVMALLVVGYIGSVAVARDPAGYLSVLPSG